MFSSWKETIGFNLLLDTPMCKHFGELATAWSGNQWTLKKSLTLNVIESEKDKI